MLTPDGLEEELICVCVVQLKDTTSWALSIFRGSSLKAGAYRARTELVPERMRR